MLSGRNGPGSSSPKKVFAGVRFVLVGFDSVSEAQYRSELVREGGVDVGRYDSSCTHVIVSGRVYDDPVCVAARHDGKTLVTELWVDDCVDFGTVANAARVIYRPVKDLNGISGSESLYICLTGYQRQERDDIMRMVSLMGARFTKPLIANQVTHLMCYKFEGEKYELAKKVKIKLVNHRWLEDCLKEWEILPIDNYTRSGWELEISEAEARDSEEETEDAGVEVSRERSSLWVSNLQSRLPAGAASDVSIPNMGVLNVPEDKVTATPSYTSRNSPMNNRLLSTPCKENRSGKASDVHVVNNEFEFIQQDARGIDSTCGSSVQTSFVKARGLSTPGDTYLEKEKIALSSDARPTIMASTSSGVVEKLSSPACSKITPKKFISLQHQSNNCSATLWNLEEDMLKGEVGIPTSASKERRKSETSDLLCPSANTGMHHLAPPSDALPQKRKGSTTPEIGTKSPKSECHSSRTSDSRSPSTKMSSLRLEPTTAVPQDNSGHGVNASKYVEGMERASISIPSRFKSLSYKKRSLKRGQPADETKTSSTTDSLSGSRKDLSRNVHVRQELDEPVGIARKSPVSEMSTASAVVTAADVKVLQDLALDDDPRQAMDVDTSLENTEGNLENWAVNGRNKHETSQKIPAKTSAGSREVKMVDDPENGGDIAANYIHEMLAAAGKPEQTQQNGVFLTPDSRDSDTRKLSSTASTEVCEDNNTKLAVGVRTKKVAAKRNFGCRSKLSTGNSSKDNHVTTTDEYIIPSKAAVESGRLGKVKAEAELEKTNKNRQKETIEPVPKGTVMENKVGAAKHPIPKDSREDNSMNQFETSMDPEKENKPKGNGHLAVSKNSHTSRKVCRGSKKKVQHAKGCGDNSNVTQTSSRASGVISEPVWFIMSGHRLQRKEFQAIIKRLKGRVCRDSHQWSYQATHFVVPDPVRRTEKFFAAAAAGRWILKTDYLTASSEAGKFLEEEPFEWHGNGLTEDGAISLEAPRKWRLLRKRTGHGALYGLRIVIYGDCIAPTLDTLKRVVKAGDGIILATSPPYTRFLRSGIDYAIISSSMPRVDSWVQELLRHQIPCVAADYLVEYVCKPGYSLERHVLYNTQAWAEKSLAIQLSRSEEVIADASAPSEDSIEDLSCSVCGSRDRGEVMLICGDENGAVGCGAGTHIDCCDPPFEAVPQGDWLCPECSSNVCKTPLKDTKKRSSSKCR